MTFCTFVSVPPSRDTLSSVNPPSIPPHFPSFSRCIKCLRTPVEFTGSEAAADDFLGWRDDEQKEDGAVDAGVLEIRLRMEEGSTQPDCDSNIRPTSNDASTKQKAILSSPPTQKRLALRIPVSVNTMIQTAAAAGVGSYFPYWIPHYASEVRLRPRDK
jgi:hypothetical protein